jgi:flavin reductase (DIM6/NTAB) family NADH-FMN oxidoreductase RutF
LIIDPREHHYSEVYKLMIGAIVPRPIAFVSTVSAEGVLNLAPFSFFMGVCPNPPTVAFAPVRREGAESRKDTLANVEATREFVINVVSEEMAEAMNLTSGEYPPDVDEFVVSGLTPITSDLVKPPRVGESKIAMECKLSQVVHINPAPGGGSLVLGEIVRFHIADAIVSNFKIDPDQLRAIGRMGGPSYTRTRDRFDLIRPK